jgi:ABC-type uncharacterized transport system involved in gliding motility auxiliary subunit
MDKNKLFPAIFIAGVCLLVLGCATALVQGEFTALALAMLAPGAAACIFYGVVRRKDVAETFTSRSTRYGINAAIYTLLIIAIIAVVQAIFTINSAQLDLTKNKVHTLSDETTKVLKGLKTDVDSYYFYSVSARNGVVEDTLKRYGQASAKFKTESIDADKNPAFAKRFAVDRYNMVVLNRKDTGAVEKVDQLNEEGLTNALIRLTRGEKKIVYFTKGHGEPALDAPTGDKTGYTAMVTELKSYNYDARPLELFSSQAGVPSDCGLLIMAGLQADIFDPEAAALRQYIRRGGKLFILYTAFTNTPKLDAILKSCGVTVQNDVVVDKMGRIFGGDVLTTIISSYEQHDITKNFRVATFFPVCRTFDIKAGTAGVSVAPLAKTNPGAWGETDLAGIKKGEASMDPKTDHMSPLTVAAIISIDNAAWKPDFDPNTNNSKTVIAVFGSSDMASNSYLSASANKDFVLNTVNYLAGQGDLISIRPRDNAFEPLFLSKIQGRLLFIIPTIFLPLIVAAIGVLVFIKRRRS